MVGRRKPLVRVGVSWNRFAVDNGAPGLTAARIIGRPLRDFVADPTTQQLWEALLARARRTTVPEVPFRCDSPTERRFMTLRMLQETGGLLCCEARLLRRERRAEMAFLMGDRPGAGFLTICGWCKRVPVDDEWLEVEDAVVRLRLFEKPVLPLMSHGICPPCVVDLEGLLI